MASRTILRRLCHVSKRVPGRSQLIVRPLSMMRQDFRQTDQRLPCQSYSQIRALCSKSGDGMIINIQDEQDFEDRVINSDKPVVIDFHASWCGPCKLLGPRLESLIGNKAGKVVLAKIDVDENMELAMKFAVNSVPTVLAFKNKEVTDKFIGLQDDDIIDTFLEKLIG